MNADFKTMSDLVADAEDLVARVANSQTPEVRALSIAVQRSVDLLKEQFRSARELRSSQATKLSGREWGYIVAGASLAVCIAAWPTEVKWQRRAASIRPRNPIGTA
jgi:hypothetical protein